MLEATVYLCCRVKAFFAQTLQCCRSRKPQYLCHVLKLHGQCKHYHICMRLNQKLFPELREISDLFEKNSGEFSFNSVNAKQMKLIGSELITPRVNFFKENFNDKYTDGNDISPLKHSSLRSRFATHFGLIMIRCCSKSATD